MSATVKHTLFYFTLVILLQQYLSIQPAQNRHRKQKRAILQDTESNHTIPSEVQTTMSMNLTTLTSEERIEQMKKLKEAELHLRKNLKEKGKEYENQLYENWPNVVREFELRGPRFLLDPSAKMLADNLKRAGLTYEVMAENWSEFLQILRLNGSQSFLKMVDTFKKDEEIMTLPTTTGSG
uniref:Uncharacterized protein n=1 Tax=Cacopsylla melanoneura TaxID=428564 RepID=A0A8D8LJL7_9HEMI